METPFLKDFKSWSHTLLQLVILHHFMNEGLPAAGLMCRTETGGIFQNKHIYFYSLTLWKGEELKFVIRAS